MCVSALGQYVTTQSTPITINDDAIGSPYPSVIDLSTSNIVGTIEKPIPIYRIEHLGFIHDLWVDEQYRNEGLGRQMTMLAIEKFREMGVTQVRLETAAANDVARKLFESCGFRTATVEMLVEL